MQEGRNPGRGCRSSFPRRGAVRLKLLVAAPFGSAGVSPVARRELVLAPPGPGCRAAAPGRGAARGDGAAERVECASADQAERQQRPFVRLSKRRVMRWLIAWQDALLAILIAREGLSPDAPVEVDPSARHHRCKSVRQTVTWPLPGLARKKILPTFATVRTRVRPYQHWQLTHDAGVGQFTRTPAPLDIPADGWNAKDRGGDTGPRPASRSARAGKACG